MIKIINYANVEDKKIFSEKIVKAESEYFPMLGYKKLRFHERILNNHKVNNNEIQNADFMTNHIGIIDYLDNGDYCLYHLFTTNETPDVLMTTMIVPSSFDNRYSIVDRSIKNILKWASERGSYSRFKIQVLEYGEVQVYPSLAYYLIPLLIDNGFKPQYGIYLKASTEDKLEEQQVDKDYEFIYGQDNNLDELIEFYKRHNFRNYYVEDNDNILDIILDEELFKKSLITAKYNGKIIGAIFADRDQEGKIWLDDMAVKDEYKDTNLGAKLIYEILVFLRNNYSNTDIYEYTYREYMQSVAEFEKMGFQGFEYWVDLLYYFEE